jgi:ribosomal protein S18 acetylase RimI-like enzyme
MLEITPLLPQHLPQAAELFVGSLKQLRQATPVLPAALEDPHETVSRLENRLNQGCLLAAYENQQLTGYLGWYLASNFRDTGSLGAYVPEWGHAALGHAALGHAALGDPQRVSRALYRRAGELWQQAGCRVHAITLLAHNQPAIQCWFWNGFGMAVIDAARPMQPLEPAPETSLTIRQATAQDAPLLAELDAEHCAHYAAAPTFMTPRRVDSEEDFVQYLQSPTNNLWLALDGAVPAGFMRFGEAGQSVAVLDAPQAAGITGAYIRPAYRGRRAAVALLNAGLAHYQRLGFACCGVDFESFNPEAAAFWPRYFTPVCYSLVRVPENQYQSQG